jgi:hypothetical protein
MNTSNLGPNYAVEKDPKQYIELIIDTENAKDTWIQKYKTLSDT